MKADRELDALIAEKVMGWKWAVTKENGIVPFRRLTDPDVDYSRIPDTLLPDDKSIRTLDRGYPHYSTQITDAWLVVEKLAPHNNGGMTLRDRADWDAPRWACAFSGYRNCLAEADTAPLAICLAALEAVNK